MEAYIQIGDYEFPQYFGNQLISPGEFLSFYKYIKRKIVIKSEEKKRKVKKKMNLLCELCFEKKKCTHD